jgi:mannose-6-phosphate isomerase-like protein (cupin superfamily)
MTELLQAAAGASYLVISDVITFRVTSAQSQGRLCVVEALAPPGGGPPPLHSHPPDEVFTVLEGEGTVAVQADDGQLRERTLQAGETVHVRGGTPHTFRNFSDRPLRLLATFVPGEMMEHYFVAGGIPLPDEHMPDSIDAQRQVQQAEQILLLAADVGMVVYT